MQPENLPTQTARVEVVYCTAQSCHRTYIPWLPNMTAKAALDASALAQQVSLPHPLQMGVFGLKISDPQDYILQAGDRLEIYRPLTIDPKQIRRNRAARFPVGRYRQGNQWRKKAAATSLENSTISSGLDNQD